MGEYASLYISGVEVDSWKNSIGEGAYLFTEGDGVQTPEPYYGGDEDTEECVDDAEEVGTDD